MDSPAIGTSRSVSTQHDARADYAAFIASTRSMARATSRAPQKRMRSDPGTALMELLGFADAVTLNQPARPAAPLTFPVLAQLAKKSARADNHLRRTPGEHPR